MTYPVYENRYTGTLVVLLARFGGVSDMVKYRLLGYETTRLVPRCEFERMFEETGRLIDLDRDDA